MIEINLLPEELKVKTKQKASEHAPVAGVIGLTQDKIFIYALPAILIVFVLLHLYFGVLALAKVQGALFSMYLFAVEIIFQAVSNARW